MAKFEPLSEEEKEALKTIIAADLAGRGIPSDEATIQRYLDLLEIYRRTRRGQYGGEDFRNDLQEKPAITIHTFITTIDEIESTRDSKRSSGADQKRRERISKARSDKLREQERGSGDWKGR